VFVDTDYNLCELNNEGLKVVGYREFMQRLTGRDIIINYNQSTKDFYISNWLLTFLYSPYGLTEVQQHPSAIWYSNGTQCMIHDTVDNRYPWIRTEQFDFGYRGHKNIFLLEVGAVNYDEVWVAIDWKMDNTAFKVTPWLQTNDNNLATQVIAGTDFKVNLRFSEVTASTIISYIKVRYKMTDLKAIRGIYAPPPRGQVI
jgi:hypothetical protein